MKRTLNFPLKPDTDTRLLLAWSIQCTGRMLETLQMWAATRGGEIYHDLIDDFRYKCGFAELALIHVAMLALLRLCCSQARRTVPSDLDSFCHFRRLLEESATPSPQAQAVLEDMAWAFNDALLLTRYPKDQGIMALLSTALSLPRCKSTTAIAYFTLRENLSDEDALFRQVQQGQYRWEPSGLQPPNNSPLVRSTLHADQSLQDGDWLLVDQ